VDVTIVGDLIVEDDEDFTITLENVAMTSVEQAANISTGSSATLRR